MGSKDDISIVQPVKHTVSYRRKEVSELCSLHKVHKLYFACFNFLKKDKVRPTLHNVLKALAKRGSILSSQALKPNGGRNEHHVLTHTTLFKITLSFNHKFQAYFCTKVS